MRNRYDAGKVCLVTPFEEKLVRKQLVIYEVVKGGVECRNSPMLLAKIGKGGGCKGDGQPLASVEQETRLCYASERGDDVLIQISFLI